MFTIDLSSSSASKVEKYEALLPQLSSLLGSETDEIANMANTASVLRMAFGFFWVGFYRVVERRLLLGPFQGDVACTGIAFGRGVCGTAWKERRTLVVPDVDAFADHIACSSASRSEIVVPVFRGNEVVAVLDIDSTQLADFDETDKLYLEKVVELLSAKTAFAR